MPAITSAEQGLAAVLWDMDGTIIDSEPLWIATEIAMLQRFGLEMTAQTHERMVGSGLTAAAELFRELGVPLSTEEIIAEWVNGVADGLSREAPMWRPGAKETLESLRQAGIPCALVTMSVRSLAELVAQMLPDGTFQAIVAGDEVEHEKPHPEPYLLGAAALNVPIERCVAFEDSRTGLRSASASGAIAIGIPHLVSLDEAPSHEIIDSLEGLTADAIRLKFSSLQTAELHAKPALSAKEATS